MSFFGTSKVTQDDMQAIKLVRPKFEFKIKPISSKVISEKGRSIRYFQPENDASNYVREVIRSPAIIALNKSKEMAKFIQSSSLSIDSFDIRYLSGVFAFLVLKDNKGDQHLAIKRLDDYESNHAVIHMFAKKGRFGEVFKSAQVLCGGEIFFIKGVIKKWNLKSGGYSRNTEFDEIKNHNIIDSIERLWLPNHGEYQILHEAGVNLREKYSPKGSLRRPVEQNPPSDKTQETENMEYGHTESCDMQEKTTSFSCP